MRTYSEELHQNVIDFESRCEDQYNKNVLEEIVPMKELQDSLLNFFPVGGPSSIVEMGQFHHNGVVIAESNGCGANDGRVFD